MLCTRSSRSWITAGALFMGALGSPGLATAMEPSPLAVAYSSGSQSVSKAQVKALHATVNFSAVRPKTRPAELPEQEILTVPGFDFVRAPGPAARSPLSPPTTISQVTAQPDPLPTASTDFRVFLETGVSNLPAFYSSAAPEPSVATHDQTVFVTGNWYAALSTNGGVSFNYVDPSTTFPSVNNGFCCDQVTLHEPSRDLIVWGLQYIKDANGDTFRLAVAQGPVNQAHGSFFYYDFTAQLFGFPTGDWLDFPALAYGTNKLYLSANVFTAGGSYAGTVVARLPLDPLAAGAAFSFDYFIQSVLSYKIAQGIGTTAYFLTHTASNNVRIARWTEGDSTYYWDDVGVSAFQSGGGSCPDPSATNWCGYAYANVSAAWRTNYNGGEIGVMWSAAQGGAFSRPYPYVQVAFFRESDRALLAESEVWNPSLAWQYASAGVNNRGDVGGSVAYGGGSYYVSSAIWISDDVNSHTMAPLENQVVVQGAHSNGSNRWGDFFTTWAHSHFNDSWVTVGVAPAANGASNEIYTWFGRSRDLPPAASSSFYTLQPCRVIDTRNANGPFGGPSLQGNVQRNFTVFGQCGIPVDAAAIAVNVTIVNPTASGDLRFFPAGIPAPLVSVINFQPGQVRANNAVVSLISNPVGTFVVRTDLATSGTVDLIVDVTGYFR